MNLSSRWLYPPFLIVGALLLFGGVLVGACDLLTGSTLGPGDDSGPLVPASATLAYDHMPTGASLPPPGDVPLRNGTVQAYEEANMSPETIPAKSNSSGADSSSVESPYGCYLASRPYTDAVRFRSVYLYFPESMVEAAGNETKQVILSLQAVSVEDSSAVAGNLEEAVEQRGRTGVRYANCVIPAASGAQSLASEQLLRVGEDKAAWNALAASEDTASKAAAYEQQCNVQEVTICAGPPGNQYCGTDYELNCSSSVPEAGGDGDGGPSDGGDGDGGYPGGGSGSSEGDGDGNNNEDCLDNPLPGSNGDPCDPCESSNPPIYCAWGVNDNERCSSDPLKNMEIRATGCGENASIEGGRFEGRGGEHEGLDLRAEVGTKLYSARGGTVAFMGDHGEDGWGKHVLIRSNAVRDGQTVEVVYAHLSSVNVSAGQSLSAGDKIGETGVSGNAAKAPCAAGGPAHVHIETKSVGSGQSFNGADYFDPEKFIGTNFDSNGVPVSDECDSNT